MRFCGTRAEQGARSDGAALAVLVGEINLHAQLCAAHQPPQAAAAAHAWAAHDAPPRAKTPQDTRWPAGGDGCGVRAVRPAARLFVQQAAASPPAQLHSFAPPPLLPNSTRKKSLSAPSFFAAALGKILPFFVV